MKAFFKSYAIYLLLFILITSTFCEQEFNMKRACKNIKDPENGNRCSAARFYDGHRCCYVEYKDRAQQCEYLPDDYQYIKEWAVKIGASMVDCSAMKLSVSNIMIILISLIVFIF
jgi:hypothetical protein